MDEKDDTETKLEPMSCLGRWREPGSNTVLENNGLVPADTFLCLTNFAGLMDSSSHRLHQYLGHLSSMLMTLLFL